MLNPDVIAIVMLDAILFLFALTALAISVQIVRRWDSAATTPLQYRLEKRAYLVATIIKFIFYLKLPLFVYFIYTLDLLSAILPGAMCAAGVTNATVYGMPLFVVKILDLYLFGLWIVVHTIDMHKPDYPFTKMKFWLFILIFPFFALEVGLEVLHFKGINPHVIVSCCGTLFSAAKSSAASLFITLPVPVILALFYGNFALILMAWLLKRPGLTAFLNLLFVPVAIVSLIAFFSTYVYELPHHHCPFCLLQSDYHYVGYLMYTALFAGTFFGIAAWVGKKLGYPAAKRWTRWSLIGDILYVALVSFYPIAFYLKNGVWL
ncbi:hypothetical protein [Hydrogenimonas urashimensis]|uniref:hypothetical protein n=1 Tax=Hydrogenimonas urashimensis TaxID=2740515 RepID=UPI0019156EC5|nr:hypothetical protein [Hydrogenimonas urashimensis]